MHTNTKFGDKKAYLNKFKLTFQKGKSHGCLGSESHTWQAG